MYFLLSVICRTTSCISKMGGVVIQIQVYFLCVYTPELMLSILQKVSMKRVHNYRYLLMTAYLELVQTYFCFSKLTWPGSKHSCILLLRVLQIRRLSCLTLWMFHDARRLLAYPRNNSPWQSVPAAAAINPGRGGAGGRSGGGVGGSGGRRRQ